MVYPRLGELGCEWSHCPGVTCGGWVRDSPVAVPSLGLEESQSDVPICPCPPWGELADSP